MAQRVPPLPPPPVALADDDGLRRVRLRLWQVWWTVLTILLTVWFITLGPLPAILALVTAKHVLVALLVMGLKVDTTQQPES